MRMIDVKAGDCFSFPDDPNRFYIRIQQEPPMRGAVDLTTGEIPLLDPTRKINLEPNYYQQYQFENDETCQDDAALEDESWVDRVYDVEWDDDWNDWNDWDEPTADEEDNNDDDEYWEMWEDDMNDEDDEEEEDEDDDEVEENYN